MSAMPVDATGEREWMYETLARLLSGDAEQLKH
jgi:hypothetical protein